MAVVNGGRTWVAGAVDALHREAARSADTHLLHLTLPAFPGIDFYFKDEATHPSGSLKHRLARSLFLYALCNGRLVEGQPVVDASSGSTAISEAWFARMLGLPFTAVMPDCTAPAKIEAVRALGGRCELTPPGTDPKARARDKSESRFAFLDNHLRGRDFLLDRFTVADAYLYTVLNWTGSTKVDLTPWPAIAAYHKRMQARPSIAKAFKEEFALYQAELARHKAA